MKATALLLIALSCLSSCTSPYEKVVVRRYTPPPLTIDEGCTVVDFIR